MNNDLWVTLVISGMPLAAALLSAWLTHRWTLEDQNRRWKRDYAEKRLSVVNDFTEEALKLIELADTVFFVSKESAPGMAKSQNLSSRFLAWLGRSLEVRARAMAIDDELATLTIKLIDAISDYAEYLREGGKDLAERKIYKDTAIAAASNIYRRIDGLLQQA